MTSGESAQSKDRCLAHIRDLMFDICQPQSQSELLEIAARSPLDFETVLKTALKIEFFTTEERANGMKEFLFELNTQYVRMNRDGPEFKVKLSPIFGATLAMVEHLREDREKPLDPLNTGVIQRAKKLMEFLVDVGMEGSHNAVLKSAATVAITHPETAEPLIKITLEVYRACALAADLAPKIFVSRLAEEKDPLILGTEERGGKYPFVKRLFYRMAEINRPAFVSSLQELYGETEDPIVQRIITDALIYLSAPNRFGNKISIEMLRIGSGEGSTRRKLLEDVMGGSRDPNSGLRLRKKIEKKGLKGVSKTPKHGDPYHKGGRSVEKAQLKRYCYR